MPTHKSNKPSNANAELKGWHKIAEFLGQPISVVEGWARTGMPVTRQGRYVTATKDELNQWLASESAGEPVKVVTAETDIAAELKRGLAYIRNDRRQPGKSRHLRNSAKSA